MYCLTSYASPIGLLTLGSDGKHLTGLWIQGQKYFGGENVGEIGKEQGPEPTVFGDARKWLDRYFSGQKPCPDELPLAPEGTEFQKLERSRPMETWQKRRRPGWAGIPCPDRP